MEKDVEKTVEMLFEKLEEEIEISKLPDNLPIIDEENNCVD